METLKRIGRALAKVPRWAVAVVLVLVGGIVYVAWTAERQRRLLAIERRRRRVEETYRKKLDAVAAEDASRRARIASERTAARERHQQAVERVNVAERRGRAALLAELDRAMGR